MNKKILIVEDEEGLRENISILLDAEGFEVATADNGLSAIKKLEVFTPDLILSDIMMPNLNGLELFERLKENAATRTIPFIFITAKSDPYSIRQGMNMGADDYISKPFNSDDLLHSIKMRLQKHKFFEEKIDEIRDSIGIYVPHELRTPLVAIFGYSQMIIAEIDTLEKSDIVDMVDRINYAAKRLHNRIEKFIQITDLEPMSAKNIDENKMRTEVGDFFVKEIIQNHYLIKNRASKIECSVESAYLKIPESFLRIMLTELMENAVKFSDEFSQIFVDGKIINSGYEFSITDHGIGMSDYDISQIGAYSQFNRDAYQQEGLGLGLALVKKITDCFSGNISIKSEKNKFTTANVNIPISVG